MKTTPFRDGGAAGGESAVAGIMLFGVRVTEGSPSSSSSFRKSVSMNNLSQLEHPKDLTADVAGGYASDDFVHASGRSRDRKRGTPWTEEEHRLFLIGLQQVGKGDWRGISRNFVKSRTPTQVASHAQKHFLRQNNHNRRRRRSSLFDITSDSIASSYMEEADQVMRGSQISPSASVAGRPLTCSLPVAPASISTTKTSMEVETSPLTLGQPNHRRHHHTKTIINTVRSIPIPPSAKLASLKLNPSTIPDPLPLSLRLPTSSASNSPASSSSSALPQPQDCLNSSGDSMITVA